MGVWPAQQPERQRLADGDRRAVVIGRWSDDTALLRIDDGSTFEVPVPEPLREHFEVGDEAQVDLEGGSVVSWRLPHRA